jgi:hypothetical protein
MTIGLTLNNPGDIRKNDANKWLGQIWPGQSAVWCQFDTMEHGLRAIAYIVAEGMEADSPRDTLRKLAYHYAPPTENDTEAYVDTLADHTGFDPDAQLDFCNKDDLLPTVCAIIIAEQGKDADQVTPQQIEAGVDLAIAHFGPNT